MGKRAICLNCIDGRVQLPVIEWIKQNYGVDHVDMITEPGMDGFLADGHNKIDDIKRKVEMSHINNNASSIFITGHYDCRGNPVGEPAHREQILLSVDRLKSEFPWAPIEGLWINEDWEIERKCLCT